MRFLSSLLLLALFWINSCAPGGEGEYYSLQGFTQGTTYHITYQHPTETDLTEQIDSLLRNFDASLSSYDSTSIISAINRNDLGVKTDSMFRTVFRESRRVYQVTGGAFDISLGSHNQCLGFWPGSAAGSG